MPWSQFIRRMFKHHKIISFVAGLLYVVVLQELSVPQPVFRFMVPAFLVFCLLAGYYNKKYLEHIQKYNKWVVLRSMLLFVSGFLIFLLLPNSVFRGLFLVSAFFVISLTELSLGSFSENLTLNETLLIIFGYFTSFTAWAQYFPGVRQFAVSLGKWHLFDWQFSFEPLYLLGVFFSAMLLTRAFYEFIPQSDKTKWVAAVALGLFSAETFWALGFLPLHYSAQAIVLFCLYYFCLILNYYYLFQILTIKKIQFHLILIVLACALAAIATPWQIIA